MSEEQTTRVDFSFEGNRYFLNVYRELSALELQWKALEAHAIITPYQRYEWINAWQQTCGAARGVEPFVIHLKQEGGGIECILPFGVRKTFGCVVLGFLGDKEANTNMAVFSKDCFEQLSQTSLQALLLKTIEHAKGIDCCSLHYQPMEWGGVTNPLAQLYGQPSHSGCAISDLRPLEGKKIIDVKLSSHSRKQMRSKLRKLEEHGAVALLDGKTLEERLEIAAAMLEQKRERYQRYRIPNPLQEMCLNDFLLRIAHSESNLFRLFALKVGGEIAATLLVATHPRRWSGMLNSSTCNELERQSVGVQVFIAVIDQAAREGVDCFDFGAGAADYKDRIADGYETLVESFIPVTLKGHLCVFVLSCALAAKRFLKGNTFFMSLAKKIRKSMH